MFVYLEAVNIDDNCKTWVRDEGKPVGYITKMTIIKTKAKKLNELYVGLWKACGWAGRSCRLLCSLFLTVLQIAMFCIIYTKTRVLLLFPADVVICVFLPYNIFIYFVLDSTNRKSPSFFFSIFTRGLQFVYWGNINLILFWLFVKWNIHSNFKDNIWWKICFVYIHFNIGK